MGSYISVRNYLSNGNQSTAANELRMNEINATNNNTIATLNINHNNNSRLNLLLAQIFSFNNNNGNNNNNSNNDTNYKRNQKSNPSDLISVNFANHFYMTGKKIKNLANQAHSFLFGDHLDLSFIVSHKPVNFPYESPSLETPSNYLQSLINIRKDSIKLVKFVEKEYCSVNNLTNTTNTSNNNNLDQQRETKYNIEFRFDCDCDVKIRIHYFANESYMINDEGQMSQLSYKCNCSTSNTLISSNNSGEPNASKCICLNDDSSKCLMFKKGVNILFKQPKHFIIPSRYQMSNWQFNLHENYYPIVIECRPVDEQLKLKHAHITICYIDKLQQTIHTNLNNTIANNQTHSLANLNTNFTSSSSASTTTNNENQLNNNKSASVGCLSHITYSYQIKVAKQKQFINGILFSLQEIYGIEKKGGLDNNLDDLIVQQQSNEETSNSPANVKTVSSASLLSSSTTITTTSITSSEENIPNNLVSIQNEISNTQNNHTNNLEQEQKGIECVICMCEIRNTLILPCRHLCLCKICAINLRVQSNNCPICRIPFIALIQLKLYKKRQTHLELLSERKHQLPKLELNDLNYLSMCNQNSSAEVTIINNQVDSNGNVIIEIKNRVGNESNKNEEIIVKSHNMVRTTKKLSSQFECVNIYEAFDDHNINNNNSNNDKLANSNQTKQHNLHALNKKKDKKSKLKKQVSQNEVTTTTTDKGKQQPEEVKIKAQESDFKFELNEEDKNKQKVEFNHHQLHQIDNNIRSCSVVLYKPSNTNNSLVLKKTKSLSTNHVNSSDEIKFDQLNNHKMSINNSSLNNIDAINKNIVKDSEI